ncbi:sulfurtransferase [Aquisalibacillus elongatus]|uniref:Thiosulfate/3-mercaptopyruvate sulfurtransferase n=1 Tax=Aquisalibacillus elongatus TaxID=485577 RepID=A0A3N5C8F3_9BACI|nr:sulfurtransferase [Aquisalibacillus elongatus]RPF55812.1 thiosulfate/3-mercaptopyruvate sulfurtransferase [Aquisalibacillus elongatus]
MIVSVKEAFELYEQDPSIVFADCRFSLQDPSWGKSAYDKQHISKAVYFDLEEDLSGKVEEIGGRHPLPPLDAFIKRLTNRGINQQTPVIIYDQNRAFASRMYWLLNLIGHPKVYLMNGGLEEWLDHGYPTTQNNTVTQKNDYGSYNVHESLLADQAYVKKHKDQSDVTLIDSRSYERYIGAHEPIDHKAGHIPGAKNSEWTNILDENKRFKTKEELQAYFSPYLNKKEIIVYCGSGVTAAPNVVALWEAGFSNVRLYVGSFSDWISNPENEIETS